MFPGPFYWVCFQPQRFWVAVGFEPGEINTKSEKYEKVYFISVWFGIVFSSDISSFPVFISFFPTFLSFYSSSLFFSSHHLSLPWLVCLISCFVFVLTFVSFFSSHAIHFPLPSFIFIAVLFVSLPYTPLPMKTTSSCFTMSFSPSFSLPVFIYFFLSFAASFTTPHSFLLFPPPSVPRLPTAAASWPDLLTPQLTTRLKEEEEPRTSSCVLLLLLAWLLEVHRHQNASLFRSPKQ